MKFTIDNEFRDICNNIINKNKTKEEWAEIESCDMFQSEKYCGGFDATEMEFCFSLYNKNGKEFWFQLSLNIIKEIIDGKIDELQARKAEQMIFYKEKIWYIHEKAK